MTLRGPIFCRVQVTTHIFCVLMFVSPTISDTIFLSLYPLSHSSIRQGKKVGFGSFFTSLILLFLAMGDKLNFHFAKNSNDWVTVWSLGPIEQSLLDSIKTCLQMHHCFLLPVTISSFDFNSVTSKSYEKDKIDHQTKPQPDTILCSQISKWSRRPRWSKESK